MKEAVGSSKLPSPTATPGIIRFGNFEVDTRAGELRRAGIKLKLSGQPFDVLVSLLEKPGQVVTREELHDKLWSQDTFVDFEHGLNKAINKVRDALGDDADNPRFIETLPRRGYRFLAPVVTRISADATVDNLPGQEKEDKQGVTTAPVAGGAKLRPRIGLWILAGAIGILIIAAIVIAAVPLRPPRVLRYTQLTNDGLQKGSMATDGSRIYFGEQDVRQHSVIAQVSVDGGQVSALTTFPGAPAALDYSTARSELLIADGTGFESSVWALSLPGGSTSRRVGNIVATGAAWSPDGQSIIYGKVNELDIVKADGSDPRKIATVPGGVGSPRISPDGKTWRFTLLSSDLAPNVTSLWEVGTDGSNLRPLFPNWRDRNDFEGSWTPDSRYFIFDSSPLPNEFAGGSIFAIREKRGWLESRPQPVELTAGPLTFSIPIVSRDGKKIFAAGYLNRGELLQYDRTTHGWNSYLSGISASDLDFSKDGEWVTYVLVPEGTLWRSRVDGSERSQLTIPPMRAAMPRWSPDGKTIAFMGLKPGTLWTIYTVAADGGQTEELLSDNKYYGDPNWSPDGGRLVYGESGFEPKAIHILDLQSRHTSDLPGSDGLFSPRWSPDGRFILAMTGVLLPATRTQSQTRPAKLMIFDLATQKWHVVCEARFIAYPAFSRNAKYAYFSDAMNTFFRVELASNRLETVANITPPVVMKMDDFGSWMGLAPDDSPIFLRDTSTREIYALDVDFP